jgi:hypothetical protein
LDIIERVGVGVVENIKVLGIGVSVGWGVAGGTPVDAGVFV